MWVAALLLLAAQQPPTKTLPLSQAAQQPSTVKLAPELERVLTDYERAWQAGDKEALAELFAEDGLVLSPGALFIRGREAIAAFYKPGSPLSLRAVQFATSGNVGYIIGAYTDKPGNPDRGKFTLTLRKDASGRWMIVSDMDNPIKRE